MLNLKFSQSRRYFDQKWSLTYTHCWDQYHLEESIISMTGSTRMLIVLNSSDSSLKSCWLSMGGTKPSMIHNKRTHPIQRLGKSNVSKGSVMREIHPFNSLCIFTHGDDMHKMFTPMRKPSPSWWLWRIPGTSNLRSMLNSRVYTIRKVLFNPAMSYLQIHRNTNTSTFLRSRVLIFFF